MECFDLEGGIGLDWNLVKQVDEWNTSHICFK